MRCLPFLCLAILLVHTAASQTTQYNITASLVFARPLAGISTTSTLEQYQSALLVDLAAALAVSPSMITFNGSSSTATSSTIYFSVWNVSTDALGLVLVIPQLPQSSFGTLSSRYLLYSAGQSLPPVTGAVDSVTPPLSPITSLIDASLTFPGPLSAFTSPAALSALPTALLGDLSRALEVGQSQLTYNGINRTTANTTITFTVSVSVSFSYGVAAAIGLLQLANFPLLNATYSQYSSGQLLPSPLGFVTAVTPPLPIYTPLVPILGTTVSAVLSFAPPFPATLLADQLGLLSVVTALTTDLSDLLKLNRVQVAIVGLTSGAAATNMSIRVTRFSAIDAFSAMSAIPALQVTSLPNLGVIYAHLASQQVPNATGVVSGVVPALSPASTIQASLIFAGPLTAFANASALPDLVAALLSDLSSALEVSQSQVTFNGVDTTTTNNTINVIIAVLTTSPLAELHDALSTVATVLQLRLSQLPLLSRKYSQYSGGQSLPSVMGTVSSVVPPLPATSAVRGSITFKEPLSVLTDPALASIFLPAFITDLSDALVVSQSQITVSGIDNTTTTTVVNFTVVVRTAYAVNTVLAIEQFQLLPDGLFTYYYSQYFPGKSLPAVMGAVGGVTPSIPITSSIQASLIFAGPLVASNNSQDTFFTALMGYDLAVLLGVGLSQVTVSGINNTMTSSTLSFTVVVPTTSAASASAMISELQLSSNFATARLFSYLTTSELLPLVMGVVNSVTPPLPTPPPTIAPTATSAPSVSATLVSGVLVILGPLSTTRAATSPIPAGLVNATTTDLSKFFNVSASQVTIDAVTPGNTSTIINFTVIVPPSRAPTVASSIPTITTSSLPELAAYYLNATGQPLPAVAGSVTSVVNVTSAPLTSSAAVLKTPAPLAGSGDSQNASPSSPLSGGGIAGIVIAGVVVLAAVVAVAVYFVRRRSSNKVASSDVTG